MERQRVIFLVLVIAWTLFRLLRYLRMSGAKRPPPAVPSVGSPAPLRSDTAAAAAMTASSPIEPAGTGGAGLARNLVAATVLIAGAVAIWSLLFMVPAFGNVPTPLRMIVAVVATLYLIQLAREAASRLIGAGRHGDAEDNNPIK